MAAVLRSFLVPLCALIALPAACPAAEPEATASTSGRLGERPVFSLNASRTGLHSDIALLELSVLGSHDLSVVMDRSHSMKTKDCLATLPGYPRLNPAVDRLGSKPITLLSRWQWCQQEIVDLTEQTARLPRKHITLVLFSGDYDVYKHVDLARAPHIFAVQKLRKGTRLAPALASQLREYFRKRDRSDRSDEEVRPLAIAVITDGVPDDADELRSLIIDATRRMVNPLEISVTFHQVGTDPRGQALLMMLDNELVSQGAKYDIVSTRPFPELLEKGLTRSLIDSLTVQEK